jgi:tRNA threonylcarbamoyladenosine biosynthesis protein TsaB
MLIISLDTSGRNGSAVLCRGDANSFETLQLTTLEGGTYSARLAPTIDDILQHNRLSLTDIDGFAVVSGPGSFTGLRVGLATVKGLCEVVHKPLAIVSMLEAITIAHASDGQTVTAILDAGRGEVYIGESAGSTSPKREYIAKLTSFAEETHEAGELLTPDKAVADFLGLRNVAVRLVAPVQADGIGRIGLRKLLAGEVADHATVDVNYIRRSDAEIFSAPKRKPRQSQ